MHDVAYFFICELIRALALHHCSNLVSDQKRGDIGDHKLEKVLKQESNKQEGFSWNWLLGGKKIPKLKLDTKTPQTITIPSGENSSTTHIGASFSIKNVVH